MKTIRTSLRERCSTASATTSPNTRPALPRLWHSIRTRSAPHAPGIQPRNDSRRDGKRDDREDHDGQIVPDDRDVAEEVARGAERANPDGRAGDTERKIAQVGHAAYAGHKRHVGA